MGRGHEGQAYVMLRALLMDDKVTFDRCYAWTEKYLSRQGRYGDSLLAWHWKDGAVADWMPASDADIDYALALVMADRKWGHAAPQGTVPYAQKARKVLDDILKKMTYRTSGGRLYLSPWILAVEGEPEAYPVNPSYYSPAHFKMFYEFTRDSRWLELHATTYFVLAHLSAGFDGQAGVGLIPDWCGVTPKDEFRRLAGRNEGFGWEAVRIPFRVALDHYWFHSPEAKEFLSGRLAGFLHNEWIRNKAIFCEYQYDGTPVKKYESPLFYSAYHAVLAVAGSPHSRALLNKTRSYIKRRAGGGAYYQDQREYFVNSLAWFSEFFNTINQ